jgi:hypothetical protein
MVFPFFFSFLSLFHCKPEKNMFKKLLKKDKKPIVEPTLKSKLK